MKKIVEGNIVSIKDESGAYLPSHLSKPIEDKPIDISIDDLLKAGLQNIKGAMKAISSDINTGLPSRETIKNLKDVMSMLRELKKEERDFLENASDEQLEAMLKQ